MIQRNARSGAGSVSMRLTPHKSRCTAPSRWPAANASAGRMSMSKGRTPLPVVSAWSVRGDTTSWGQAKPLGFSLTTSFYPLGGGGSDMAGARRRTLLGAVNLFADARELAEIALGHPRRELALNVLHLRIDAPQQLESRLGDAGDRKPPILRRASALHEAAAFEPVDEPRHVGRALHHARRDLAARLALRMTTFQYAQRVVLSVREIGGRAGLVHELTDVPGRDQEVEDGLLGRTVEARLPDAAFENVTHEEDIARRK